MGITLNASAANNADFKTQFQFTDGETGDLIDFTDSTIQIDVTNEDRCRVLTASTTDEKITIVSTGIFELLIPASEMHCICAGTYFIGGVYELDGETISLFTGTLTIIDGIARL